MHQPRKFRNLWLLGISIHLLSFLFVLDLYFTSPIKHGMTPQKSSANEVFAKRIVVFIADGLRAEAIYEPANWNRVKFLSDLRLNQSSTWGVVHTGVPTESRPGHVAIFAGLYEDPSAIFTGWQANTVEFDSVINESNYACSLGSPDIVKIFTKNDKDKLIIDYYNPELEDFSGRLSTINLDTWVFEHIEDLLSQKGNEYLHENGNIFFLHLLGMDTAGHVHKPDSQLYLENLIALDQGIEKTVNLFQTFFNENETAFLFTSDHGMTNWGSHGDGSEHETEVPYILWGKGIQAHTEQIDIKQADLAPLIASLINIPIPINSVGVLPHRLLQGNEHQVMQAFLANVMQQAEQYKLLLEEFNSDPFFRPYEKFQLHSVDEAISNLREMLNRNESKEQVLPIAEILIKDIQLANTYMRNFYFKPKIATVMIGFFLWMFYLALSVHAKESSLYRKEEEMHDVSSLKTRKTRVIMFLGKSKILICFIGACVALYLRALNVNYFTYLYAAFPLGIVYYMTGETEICIHLTKFLQRNGNFGKFAARFTIYAFLVELLVLGFFHSIVCAGLLIILAFWLRQFHANDNYPTFVISALGLLQVVNELIPSNYLGLIVGSHCWIFMYWFILCRKCNEYIQFFDVKYKRTVKTLMNVPLVLFCIAAANSFYVAWNMQSADWNVILSWIVTIIACALLPASPNGVYTRFGHVAACLVIPYTFMAIKIELIFFSALVLTLFCWMDVESLTQQASPLKRTLFVIDYKPLLTDMSAQYRRTYFFLAFTICYFFAIGNIASFNGFDPQWTRMYVATFNPILMTILIIIKMIIPFFIITCAFYAICVYTRADYEQIFMILLLFLEQMVLNFMLFVRNEGSWKEIGKSLSHFAIMEAMALVMLVFFGLARYLCSFSLSGKDLYVKNMYKHLKMRA